MHTTDSVLKEIIAQIDVPATVSTKNVFHDLLSCIIEQQIHYRSSKKQFERLLAKAEIRLLTPENFAKFEKEALSTITLSQKKYETILRVLEFWNEQLVDWQTLSDNTVKEKLSEIKGIGPWTVDMILLYTLGRPNVFPVDDYHLKQIMVSLYGLDPNSKLKTQMLEVSEKWKPNRSLAVKYLLEWKSSLKK